MSFHYHQVLVFNLPLAYIMLTRLDLYVYRAELSHAWQEARYGKLWEQGMMV